jgi:hypothetical protein
VANHGPRIAPEDPCVDDIGRSKCPVWAKSGEEVPLPSRSFAPLLDAREYHLRFMIPLSVLPTGGE